MKVYVKKKDSKLPDDNIYYIVAKGGFFLFKKNPVMECVIPVHEIPFLQRQKQYLSLDIPKFSKEQTLQIYAFFVRVYRIYRSESILTLHYRRGTCRVLAPTQRVFFLSVNYARDEGLPNHLPIGSIHCHAYHMAFRSEGRWFTFGYSDEEDEASFDGLHVVFGNINSKVISISCSFMVSGRRFILDPLDYFDGIKEVRIRRPKPPKIHHTVAQRQGPDWVMYPPMEPFDPYWAPNTGCINWYELLERTEKQTTLLQDLRGSKVGKLLLGEVKKEKSPWAEYEKQKEIPRELCLMNPDDPDIPLFFSVELPEGKKPKDIPIPREWMRKVKMIPVKRTVKKVCGVASKIIKGEGA